MRWRHIVASDPQSFAVRDVDQFPSIIQKNAADCVEALKFLRIRRITQVEQSYELGGTATGTATSAATDHPFSFRGCKCIASAFCPGVRCLRDGQPRPDHLQLLPKCLIRQVHPVDDV